jgi:hypothetical protein
VAESFNPYAEWLGVRSAAARPNHYELLRLEPFESDQDAILTAANMQMAKVRGIRPGEHLDHWRRLLDELGAAKRCLTDGMEKPQYDAALREKGWPIGTPTSDTAGSRTAASMETGSESSPKRSPYMEVTGASASNPIPPQIGGGKSAVGNSASAAPWQPGTNLLPPSPRVSPDASATNKGGTPISLQPSGQSSMESPGQSHSGAAANGWIPPPASEKAWTPPSSRAVQPPGSPAAPSIPNVPAAPVSPAAAGLPAPASAPPSVPAPKPKLQFPGETVAPAPVAPVSAPAAPSPVPGVPAPMSTFPTGVPQPGGVFNQFPRPFPPVPIPGLSPQGATPPQPMPPSAVPQQPFAGQFFPGGPMRPGPNPQFQQFAPGAPGMPNYVPNPPGAPNPYAPMPMPPQGGIPGYYPQQNPMPGFAVNYPPQGMPPQGMMPQMPQAASPAAGPSFLDDVLSGPNQGGPSPIDDLGFGGSATAPQPAAGWQPSNFPQPLPVAAIVDGFGQAAPPSPQADYEPSPSETIHRPRHSARPRQSSRTMLVGGALAAVVLLAAALVVVMIMKQKEPVVAVNGTTENGSTGSPTQPSSTKTSGTPKTPAHDTPNPKNSGTAVQPVIDPANKTPVGTSTKNPSATMPTPAHPAGKTPGNPSSAPLVIQPTNTDPATTKPAKPVVDPVKAARLTRMLADVRHKLAERNQAEAERLIADAKPLAITPEQTDRVQRMGALVRYVGEFWGAVRDAMGGLKATDEIDVGTTKAVVVERDEQSLTIHIAGGNKRFTLHDMPGGFAVVLANRWLDQSKPENKVFIGAFYAVDPKHEDDRDDAKRLWSEAAAAGVSDGAFLLPLLNPEPAAAEMPGGESDPLPPVPEVNAINRATRKVKEEFDDAIVAATTPTKLSELIQRLFDAADSSDDPVRRYALCIEARDSAAKAGRAKLAIEAIDRIAKEFRVDALEMKADTFSNFPPTTAPGGRELTRAALALVDEALSAKRIPLASRLAQIAVAAAKVSQGNDLIRRATQRSNEVDALANK